jgi:CRISPR-associated endonuclease/helicase Cas3
VWAKLGHKDYQERHPVICHLADVAVVCLQLWERVLPRGLKARIARCLDRDPATVGRWMAFWAGAHDIGKVAPCFQRKDRSGAAEMALKEAGFDFPPSEDIPHGILSTCILADLLAKPEYWPAAPPALARRIAVAVGGHHGVFPATAQWFDLGSADLGNRCWSDTRHATLVLLAETLGVTTLPPPASPPDREHAFFMLLAGLTSVADWIGSNQTLFPAATGSVNVKEYLLEVPDRASRALDELGWTGWTASDSSPRTFVDLFRKTPRPLQREVGQIAPALIAPALVLIEAPMGEGKTEAALLLADHWTHAAGQGGLYFALPTQATSNQMFDRVRSYLAQRYPQDCVNLHLLHGQALLSDAYGELRRKADERRQSVPLVEIYDETGPGEVVAESWFAQNKKQSLLAPFAVGTIDQALLAVLQTKHVFVRLFGLAGKTVILDEIHAYDAYMSVLLERLLEWLAALGCPVLLLSATLPADKRRQLLAVYAGNFAEPPPANYPRITVARAESIEAIPLPTDPSRRQTVALEWHNPGRLADDLVTSLQDGGCAGVVCNTVGCAQEVFEILQSRLRPQGIEVGLFHARFPFARRMEIERRVLEQFGPPGSGCRPAKAVLVATQVIEQSLDLDFDLLVTEVAPADLVLQRAGRLHRHDGRQRPARLKQPQVWLLEPEQRDGLPYFGRSEFVYERFVLLRSYLALVGRIEIRLPEGVESLIEAVYGNIDLAPNATWRSELAVCQEKLRRRQKEDRQAAHDFLIRSPGEEDDILEDFCRQLEEDNPEVHRTHQALTRLAEPSLNLVLLHERGGRLFLTPDFSAPVDLTRVPTLAEAKRILGNAVTVTHRPTVLHYAAEPPVVSWQESALLRFHRVARLDAAGMAQVGAYTLRLDAELGLTIRRPADQGENEPCAST